MRLITILIASGLLMLLKIVAEPPPPLVPFYVVAHASMMPAEGSRRDLYQSPHKDVPFYVAINALKIDGIEDEYQGSATERYSGEANKFSPSYSKLDNLSALYPADLQNEPSQDSSNDVAMMEKATPTVMPKATATAADKVMESYQQSSALPVTGFAMYYNPNVMQEVLNNRLAMGHVSACDACIGNVALLRAGDLNRRVWLQWGDGTVEGPFLVADVAAPHHVPQLLARNWVVDVDYRTASRRGMLGPEWVTVLASPPTDNVPSAEPFAPLYAAPTHIPTATPLPVISTEPSPTSMPTTAVIQGGLPTDVPVPTMTPLPVIVSTAVPTTVVILGGFPTDTPVPTITPLPVIVTTSAPTAVVTASFPTETPTPTITPLPVLTSTYTPTATPPLVAQESPTMVVTQRGFPADTPVPTITPLPAINQSTNQSSGQATPTN